MHKLAVLSLSLLPLAACTAVLGDFTVGGTGDAGDSGSSDVNIRDGGSGDGDAAPTLTLKCAEPANVRTQLTVAGQAAWDRIMIAPVGNGQLRVVVNESKLHAITFNPNQPSNASNVTAPDSLWNVLDIVRYGPPGAGGFAALVVENIQMDGSNGMGLFVEKMPDSSNTWTNIPVTPPNPFGNNTNRLEGALVVLDPTVDEYFLLNYLSQDNGATYTLYAAHEKAGAPLQPTKINNFSTIGSSGNSPYDLSSPSAFFDGQQIHYFLGPNGGGGGGDAGPPFLQGKIDLGASQPSTRLIPPAASGSEFAMGMTGDNTHADLAFMIGNLATIPTTGSFHLGSVPLVNLDTYLPENLPASPIPLDDAGNISLQDLPIDKAQFHWEAFSGVNNLFGLSRTANFFGPLGGVNFLWADTTHGAFIARQTGANKLLADVSPIYKANVTLIQAVGPTLVQFAMVYENELDQNGQTQPGALWYTNINCAP